MQLLILTLLCGVPLVLMTPVANLYQDQFKKNLEARAKAEPDVKTLSCDYWQLEQIEYYTYCSVPPCRWVRIGWSWFTFYRRICRTIRCKRYYYAYRLKKDYCEAEKPTSCDLCQGDCCYGQHSCKYSCRGKTSQCYAQETFDNEPCKLDKVCNVCDSHGLKSHPCTDECPSREYIQCEPSGTGFIEHVKNCSENTAFIDGHCVHSSDEEAVANYVIKECEAQCENGEMQVHDEDCSKYEVCEHGVWREMTCHHGLVYDPDIQGCNHPSVVKGKCNGHSSECEIGAFDADDNDCKKFKMCDNGKWTSKTCPPGTNWDRLNKRCDSESNVPCTTKTSDGDPDDTESETCEGDVYKPHSACKGYQRCVHGRWMVMKCPPGTVWIQASVRCDFPPPDFVCAQK